MSDDETSATAEASSAELGVEESALLQRIYEVRRRKAEAKQRELADFTEALSEFVATGSSTRIGGLLETAVMKNPQVYKEELEKFQLRLEVALGFVSDALTGKTDPGDGSVPPPAAPPAAEPASPQQPETSTLEPTPTWPSDHPSPAPASDSPAAVYTPPDDSIHTADVVDEGDEPSVPASASEPIVPMDPDPDAGRQGRAARHATRPNRDAQFNEAKADALQMKDDGEEPDAIVTKLTAKYPVAVVRQVQREVISKMGVES
jgi:hypothetical protein